MKKRLIIIFSKKDLFFDVFIESVSFTKEQREIRRTIKSKKKEDTLHFDKIFATLEVLILYYKYTVKFVNNDTLRAPKIVTFVDIR